MRIYLDNCVFNRPFDDQRQTRIRAETDAVNEIRHLIEQGSIELVWSYMIDLEASRNPFSRRRQDIETWKTLAILETGPSIEIMSIAINLRLLGFREMDAQHISCAIDAKSSYFITTDDAILKKSAIVTRLQILDPIELVKEIETP